MDPDQFDVEFERAGSRLGLSLCDGDRVKLYSPSLLQIGAETSWDSIEVVWPESAGENQTSRVGREVLTLLDFVERYRNGDAPDGVKGGSWVYDAMLGGHGSKECLSQTTAGGSHNSVYVTQSLLAEAAEWLKSNGDPEDTLKLME